MGEIIAGLWIDAGDNHVIDGEVVLAVAVGQESAAGSADCEARTPGQPEDHETAGLTVPPTLLARANEVIE